MSRITKKHDVYHHENLKEDILNTAQKIYLSEGLEKLTVRSIAKILEVSPMAFYHYFKSLDELIDTLINKYLIELEMVSYNNIQNCESGYEKLYRLGEAYVMYAFLNPKKFALVFNLNKHVLAFDKPIEDILLYRVLFDVVGEIVGQSVPDQNKKVATLSAWSLVHGLATLYTTNLLENMIVDENIARQVTKQVVRSIKL